MKLKPNFIKTNKSPHRTSSTENNLKTETNLDDTSRGRKPLKENINDLTAHPYKKWYVDPVGLKHPELIEKQKSFLEISFKILAFDDLMKARKA